MATLKDAERAREQTAEYLRGLGAHAVSVEEEPALETQAARPQSRARSGDPGEGVTNRTAATTGTPRRRRQSRRFAVVAWFDGDPPADLPDRLEVIAGKGTRTVPLRARREERFQAE